MWDPILPARARRTCRWRDIRLSDKRSAVDATGPAASRSGQAGAEHVHAAAQGALEGVEHLIGELTRHLGLEAIDGLIATREQTPALGRQLGAQDTAVIGRRAAVDERRALER